jgi:hypothetical protein
MLASAPRFQARIYLAVGRGDLRPGVPAGLMNLLPFERALGAARSS